MQFNLETLFPIQFFLRYKVCRPPCPGEPSSPLPAQLGSESVTPGGAAAPGVRGGKPGLEPSSLSGWTHSLKLHSKGADLIQKFLWQPTLWCCQGAGARGSLVGQAFGSWEMVAFMRGLNSEKEQRRWPPLRIWRAGGHL